MTLDCYLVNGQNFHGMEELIRRYTADSLALLERLIAIPSVSRDEKAAADMLEEQLKAWGLHPQRHKNNLVMGDSLRDDCKQGSGNTAATAASPLHILLNAHIDTVKPSDSWTRKPFSPTYEGDRLYGLGANDCGGGLVALVAAYRILTTAEGKALIKDKTGESPMPQLTLCLSAEEEVSGKDGFEYVRQFLPPVDVAIVGEPTAMQPAIAEKGLMVVDLTAHGKSGHAARNEGINAIYEALDDINWIHGYRFEKTSKLLGDTKMTLSVINAGSQHNVVPDRCEMVLDVRTNEHYTNEEVCDIIRQHCKSEVKPRSFRLSSSHIQESHPLIQKLKSMGRKPYGSPTLSDQALMPWQSFKLGPGDSARSHTADEYICVTEIEEAVRMYIELLSTANT